jgi:hypothetical protein
MTPPPKPAAPSWKERLFSAQALKMLVLTAALGAAAAAGGWQVWLKPQRDVARMRFETTRDVLSLYGLEMQYKKAKGVYASDLDALLALAPDGAARKADMGRHLDLTTLAIVGDAQKFKIEANVLDADRTLIKIRGPIQDRPAPRAEIVVPLAAGSGVDGGRPVAPTPSPSPSPAPAPRR